MDDAVHEIHIPALEVRPDGGHVTGDRRVLLVTEVDEGFGRDQPEHEPRKDAYRSERAMHHLEDQRSFIVGRAGEHISFCGDDLILDARVVETSIYEGHGLDGASRHGPSDGDCLEFRDDNRHEAHGEGPVNQLAERDSRLGDTDAPIRVDLDDLVEVEQVDLFVGVLFVMNLGDLVRDDSLLPGKRRCAFPPTKLLRDPHHLLGMSRV